MNRNLVLILCLLFIDACVLFSQELNYNSTKKGKIITFNLVLKNNGQNNTYITDLKRYNFGNRIFKISKYQGQYTILDFHGSAFGNYNEFDRDNFLNIRFTGYPLQKYETFSYKLRLKILDDSFDRNIYFILRVFNKCSQVGTLYLIPVWGNLEFKSNTIHSFGEIVCYE